MFFTISLYIALAIFAVGLIYKISSWFRYKTGPESEVLSTSDRVTAAFKGILKTVFSVKVFTLLKVFFLDVLLQMKLLREDGLRWLMHMCIFWGFMVLLLMHALEQHISVPLFDNYYSTLNPYMFIRDLSGAVILLGIGIAIYRRVTLKSANVSTGPQDRFTLVILAIILISGIFLESMKIVSYTRFQEMVEEYGDPEDKDESAALEAYWVENFSVVSPNVAAPFDEAILAAGKSVHEAACMECHSQPHSAFLGYGGAQIIKPAALFLDGIKMGDILWYLHFLACFVGLAYLPFSKLFHIIASPLSMLAESVADEKNPDPANATTRQILAMDACTHCSACTLACPVVECTGSTDNPMVCPSEKMALVKALCADKELSKDQLEKLKEGAFKCLLCIRCEEKCLAGIDMMRAWQDVRLALYKRGLQPEEIQGMCSSVLTFYNLYNISNDERTIWTMMVEDQVLPRINKKAEVAYFVGCISSFTGRIGVVPEATVEILEASGVDYTVLGPDEWCCGNPLFFVGQHEEGKKMAQHNVDKLRSLGVKTVITNCAGCFRSFTQEYPKVLGKSMKDMGIEVLHFSQYQDRLLDEGSLKLNDTQDITVTYHDPCELGRHGGVYDEPRAVLRKLPGVKLVEMAESRGSSACCGGGGLLKAVDVDLAGDLAVKRTQQAMAVGAAALVSSCVTCRLQMSDAVMENDLDIEIYDISEFVAQFL